MSGPLPRSVHDLTAARIRGIVRGWRRGRASSPMHFLADILPGVDPW
jgi:hypothetical protein